MSIGAGGVIDEFFIALGFKVDPAGMRGVRQQVDEARESILSVGTALKTFVAGMAVKEIASIGSTFEQNGIQIAGFLSALSGGAMDYEAALQPAADVMAQITKDAAKLPGEAEEYIEVFKAGLPFVKGAMPGGSLSDITHFTNQLTAIGKTFGIDAGTIAREFDHMLSPGKGMASLRLPLFRQLLSFMPTLQNGARVTAESFNAMSAPERLQVLQSTFSKLQPMLDASASSFDAMAGAATSMVKQLTRTVTAGLFEQMKRGLDQINHLFYKDDGSLTQFGKNFVDGAKKITKAIGQILSMVGGMLGWLVKSEAGSKLLKAALLGVGLALSGLALEGTISSFGKLFGALTNIKRLLTGGVFVAIALIAEDLYVFSQGGDSVTGRLLEKFPMLKEVFHDIKEAAGDLLSVMGDLKDLIGPSLFKGASKQADDLGDSFNTLKEGIVIAATAIGIALTVAFAPVTATIAAVAGLTVMFKQLSEKRGFFYNQTQKAGKAIAEGLEGIFGVKPAAIADMGGAGVLAGGAASTSPWSTWTPRSGGNWSSSTDRSTTINNNSRIDKMTVVSPNSNDAGKAVQRSLARNSQTGVSH